MDCGLRRPRPSPGPGRRPKRRFATKTPPKISGKNLLAARLLRRRPDSLRLFRRACQGWSSSWTTDGFVLVDDVELSDNHLSVHGKRLPVVCVGHGFQFSSDSPKKREKARTVDIRAELAPSYKAEQVDGLTAKIFLTERDSLVAVVPWYWQTCVSAGLNQVNDPKFAGCLFTADLLSVPGMNAHVDLHEKGQSSSPPSEFMRVFRVNQGVSAPRAVFAPEPQFTDLAREMRLRGTVTLGMIVDDRGVPRNVEILHPLGGGLDEEAISTISNWKFKPGQKDGQPVATEIAVEVDFHLF